jgi:hypothetical protein
MPERPTEFTLRPRPLLSTVPAMTRVRSALKALRRSYRLQCTECREMVSPRPERRARS